MIKKIDLHPSQRDVFTDQLLHTESAHYNIGGYYVLKGILNKEILHKAIRSTTEVFDSLRMKFVLDDEGPVLYLAQDFVAPEMQELDFSTEPNPTEAAGKWVLQHFNIPFTIGEHSLLFENYLIKISAHEYWCTGKFHHLIMDGYGFIVYLKYIADKYYALINGNTEPFSFPSYAAAAQEASEYFTSADYGADEAYWKEKIPVIPAPLFSPKYAIQAGIGKSAGYTIDISGEQKKWLDELQISTKAGLQHLTIAALTIYLANITDQQHFVFGIPVHKRNSKKLRNIVGMFSGVLPFKGSYSADEKLSDLITKITQAQRIDYRHQHYPIGDLTRAIKTAEAEGNLQEITVNYEPFNFSINFGDQLEASITRIANENEVNSLQICWRDYGNNTPLQLDIVYSTEHFSQQDIALFVQRLLYIMEQFVVEINNLVSGIKILPMAEASVIAAFSYQQATTEIKSSLVTAFEIQAVKTLGLTALIFEGQQLTYQQLNQQVNQLAHYLNSLGIKQETLVVVCMEQSISRWVSILAILKAGGAYVPVDPAYPADRIHFILNDTAASLCLTTSASLPNVPASAQLTVICFEEIASLLVSQPVHNINAPILPASLAYIIYTSGTTGQPKGVMIEHGTVLSLIHEQTKYFGITNHESILQFSNYCFDASVEQVFLALLNGAALVLFPDGLHLDIEAFSTFLLNNKITHLHTTPSFLENLPDEISPFLKRIIAGGDTCKLSLANRFKNQVNFCNEYGPTETTVTAIEYQANEEELNTRVLPIGKPLSGISVSILNAQQQPCPVGISGEIYIGGNCVARGYLNRPLLTAEKFVTLTLNNTTGRWYRTGDIGYYLPDGNIICQGRTDEQVKIRGFRIEPSEIESVLQLSGMVKQAVVFASEDSSGDKNLVAFVVPGANFTQDEIKANLKSKLPYYMIPAAWIMLEQIPLTTNGKVDKKALSCMMAGASAKHEYTPPQTPAEKQLTVLWQQLIDKTSIGIHDNFFEIGGHSLLAMRLIAAIRKSFAVGLSVKDLFANPTIAALANYITLQNNTALLPPLIKAIPNTSKIPLSFQQERLWFISQLNGSSLQYHIPAIIKLEGDVDKSALAYAIQQIINRHEALRTVINEADGNGFQLVLPPNEWELSCNEIVFESNAAYQQYISRVIDMPFDLSKDYMLRAQLISSSKQQHSLVIVIHHIAFDGWSASIIINELVQFYKSYRQDTSMMPPALPVQYADFSIWQRQHLQGEILYQKLLYWTQQLSGAVPLLLPTDYARPAVQSFKGATFDFFIDENLSAQVRQLSDQQGSTIFMTLLTVFKVLLHRYSTQHDITVGTVMAGRQQQETEQMIGFFVNTLAIRTIFDQDTSFIQLLQQVKSLTLQAFDHQDLPFEKVVEAVVKDRNPAISPLFQVLFVLQNTPDMPSLILPGLSVSLEPQQNQTAKFDLSLYIAKTGNSLHGVIEYCSDLFSPSTIAALASNYKNLVAAIVARPGQKTGLLKMIDNNSQKKLIAATTGKKEKWELNKTLPQFFEDQVNKTPEAIALRYNDEKITYQQLHDQSSQLANYLLTRKNIQQGDTVFVFIDNSIAMVAAILAVLKAGAVYVPVDTSYPQERIAFMLEDSGATTFIVNHEIPDFSFLRSGNIAVVVVNDPEILLQHTSAPGFYPQSSKPACTVFTSGSSGRPKGVQLSHTAIMNRLQWMWQAYPFKPGEQNIIKTSIGFVDHIWEIFGALYKGISSVIVAKKTLHNLDKLIAILQQEKISRIVLVPSLLKTLLTRLSEDETYLPHLKYCTCSGETLPAELVTAFYKIFPSAQHKLLNIYGSSEVTADVTCYDTAALLNNVNAIGQVPIGKPISNTTVYLLDRYRQVVPVGAMGEICVAGVQVAHGYINLPDLTASRFIPDPYSENSGTTMFCTGDYGRLLPGGDIAYLGRIDSQVKIRGNRIELAEIETIIKQTGGIKEAVVVTNKDKAGDDYLVGYFVANEAKDHQQMILHLQQKLPDYMIPYTWVQIDTLPLTASGKTDKKLLPTPGVNASLVVEYTAPRTALEQELAIIWQQLLNKAAIGIYDNFFYSGGHSLLAMRMIAAIRKTLSTELEIRDLFTHPTIATLAEFVESADKLSTATTLTKVLSRPATVPLSYSQERLWFINQMDGSSQYHIPALLKLSGQLNVAALENAFVQIIDRHEILRTVILDEMGALYQQTIPLANWQLTYLNSADYKDQLPQKIEELIAVPFNLSKHIPLRAVLITTGENEYLLLIILHHIASDGWSAGILISEMQELYSAALQNRAAVLTPLPIQYTDFAIWQRSYLHGVALNNKIDYWKKKLDGVTPLQLPTDFTRPLVQSINGAVVSSSINSDLLSRLKAFGQQQESTLFITLLTAFNVLLHRHSGQQDICVGIPVAGRQQQELEGLIGFFVNTLSIRTDMNGSMPLAQLIGEVKNAVLEAYDHQQVPFEKVVEAVVKERDISRSPLFQVMFTLQPAGVLKEFSTPHLSVIPQPVAWSAKFDLSFILTENDGIILIDIEYCTDLFKPITIERLLIHFKNLLQAITTSPNMAVGELPMLDTAETHHLLNELNHNESILPEKTVVDFFAEQVLKNPTALALVFEDERLSYAAVDERSTRLAAHLLAKGLQHEQLVLVCMHRNTAMVISLLAILKAGGAYVPIDPGYPAERIAFMLKDTAAKIVLTNGAAASIFNEIENIILIDTDNMLDWPAYNPILQMPVISQLAYVIYTSGSTGKPKGVMITHSALTNLVAWHQQAYEVNNTSRATVMAGVGFDALGWEIWPYLSAGATLYLIADQTRLDTTLLVGEIVNNLITHSFIATALIPGLIKSLSETDTSLQYVLTGGDQLPAVAVKDFSFKLVNNYGPTENTVVATFYTLTGNETNLPPIGKPVTNTTIYLLNDQQQPVPKGVPGEIYIGGAGVAKGYWNLPELTNKKFLPDPFSKMGGARLYRSGDIGRYLPDGNIEYLGRADEQLKIRGFRIEPGEIASCTIQSGFVTEAIILAKIFGNEKRLVGYVIPSARYSEPALNDYLSNILPAYMIPTTWITMDNFPLTTNGKVNRNALPDIAAEILIHGDQLPVTALQIKLADSWKELLHLQNVGIDQNFFALGGHSLLAMQAASAVKQQLNIPLFVKDIFIHPTIAELANLLEQRRNQTVGLMIEKQLLPQHIPLSFSQERLWFIDQLEGTIPYNAYTVLQLDGVLNQAALSRAFCQVIDRHQVLRTVFYEFEGKPFQHVITADDWQLEVVDENYYKATSLKDFIKQLVHTPFNLAGEFMLKAYLVIMGQHNYRLIINMHHIAADAWSLPIIISEIITCYEADVKGQIAALPALPLQYADYAIWQRNYFSQAILESKINFWAEKLRGVSPLALPTDFSRPSIRSNNGASANLLIDKALTKKLTQVSSTQGVTLFMLLLTAYKVMLNRYSGQPDICVGASMANRSQQELEGLVGFFVNTLAFRTTLEENVSFIELLQSVKHTTLEAYDNQDVPFEKIVEAVATERDASRTPIFQVMLVLLNTPQPDAYQLSNLTVTDLPIETSIAKFDITFHIIPSEKGLEATIIYNKDLFRADTIKRMSGHFKQLLISVTENPEQNVESLQMLTSEEEQQLLMKFD